MKITRLFPALGLLSALLFHPVVAQANGWYTGYLCFVSRVFTNETTGTTGHLVAEIYTSSGCAGTFVGLATLCGTGATANGCQPSLASDAALGDTLSTLAAARLQGYQVSLYVVTGTAVNGIEIVEY